MFKKLRKATEERSEHFDLKIDLKPLFEDLEKVVDVLVENHEKWMSREQICESLTFNSCAPRRSHVDSVLLFLGHNRMVRLKKVPISNEKSEFLFQLKVPPFQRIGHIYERGQHEKTNP